VSKCAICGKPQDPKIKPFCSKRCADVDLNRWFSGGYAIPASEEDDPDDESTATSNPPSRED
jgi:uncharacterized protein